MADGTHKANWRTAWACALTISIVSVGLAVMGGIAKAIYDHYST